MAVTFKELSLIAELHYSRLPDAFKVKASEFFDNLDLDGDGIVTIPELLNSNLEGKFGEEFIKNVFYSLDLEGKGHLDFRESLALYYLCMYSARICEGCERNIPHGLGYTCYKCWMEGASSVNGQAFSLCLECYASLNYQHQHDPLHLLHDFVLFDNLLHDKPSSATAPIPAPVRVIEQTVKQCIVCGDYHESGARGFTCDVHMARKRDSAEFVCEWCFSYLCCKCGNLFRDSTTRAEPGKWLQRFTCPSCHQKNITTDCYDASLRKLQRVLGGVELLNHCKTCEIKHRNGTLFWIVNGTNMAPQSLQQSRAYATTNERPRNTSFDNQQQANAASHSQGGRGVGIGSSHVSDRGNAGMSTYGDRRQRINRQQEDSSGSSHGGGSSSRGGGGRGGMNQMYSQDEGNMDYASRSTMQDDERTVSSRSSSGSSVGGPRNQGSSGGSVGGSVGGPRNQGNFVQTAAAAMRTANRVIDVANMAAKAFNGISNIGGTSGGDEGASSIFDGGQSSIFGSVVGGDDGSGESVFTSVSSMVGSIVSE